MKLYLTKKPKNPVLVEGFPGFGLIGTIATEFLIDQLKAELIGTIKSSDMPAIVAIHEQKVVQPLGVFYDKKHNIVILHVIANMSGLEWEVADTLVDLAKALNAKEIISLEGVGSPMPSQDTNTFYYTNNAQRDKKFKSLKIDPIKEGIILGVTGALLLEITKIPITCLFAETHSTLPDSKAAAKIVEILAKYLGLKIETKPLLKQAEKFEEKIKGLLDKSKVASEEQMKKKLSYVG